MKWQIGISVLIEFAVQDDLRILKRGIDDKKVLRFATRIKLTICPKTVNEFCKPAKV
jgi:hypothetical protein